MRVPGRVVITGAGAICSLADSVGELQAALQEGRSGIKPLELFSPNGMGPQRAGEIRPFEPRTWLGERNLRPVDRTARLLLAAAQQALDASGWTLERRKESEVGLVLGTMYCSVHTISAFDRRNVQLGPSYASPFDFANSVINAAAGQAAIWHHLWGVNTTIAAGEASGLVALTTAADLIRGGRAAAVLAGGAEELCHESYLAFHRSGRLAGRRPVPFDDRRDGMALAEGAAILVLEEADSATARGAAVLAEVLGHGAAFDPTGGEGSARAMERAVGLALEDAGSSPEQIDAVSTGANGSIEEDRREALGIAAALGGRAAAVPVTAVKSMFGEALGASGALQTVAALGTLRDGVLPGIPDLESTGEDFPLPSVSAQSRAIEARRILVTASGMGGHCCALVLGRMEG